MFLNKIKWKTPLLIKKKTKEVNYKWRKKNFNNRTHVPVFKTIEMMSVITYVIIHGSKSLIRVVLILDGMSHTINIIHIFKVYAFITNKIKRKYNAMIYKR